MLSAKSREKKSVTRFFIISNCTTGNTLENVVASQETYHPRIPNRCHLNVKWLITQICTNDPPSGYFY